MPSAPDPRRRLPSVDALLRSDRGRRAVAALGRDVVRRAVQDALAEARATLARGRPAAEPEPLLTAAVARAEADLAGIGRTINATGVVLHTGLGRAPLALEAADAVARVATGYADLEVERTTGARGRRTSRTERLLAALTGAEAALTVNNGAAALLLSLAALAGRREVVVSRGELIEIGGEFRLPEVMAASGARLVEVGTTNRTRGADYRRAIGPRTALILKVHPSNYRVVGFTESVAVGELAGIARESGVPLLFDVGSGLLRRRAPLPSDEPAIDEALAAGADLVCFSGDKLLGGPQAGLLVGRRDLVDRARRHPIARAVRVDKMTVAALEATLRLYATGRAVEIPLWTLLATPRRTLLARARALAAEIPGATARASETSVGGGSVPGTALPSAAVVVPAKRPDRLAARLRTGPTPVFCRVEVGGVALDLRAVAPDEDALLAAAVRAALEAEPR